MTEGPSPGQPDGLGAKDAVKALARCAELLEEQLDGDGTPPPGVDALHLAAARIARLEGKVDLLASDVDALQQRWRGSVFAPAVPTGGSGKEEMESMIASSEELPAFQQRQVCQEERLEGLESDLEVLRRMIEGRAGAAALPEGSHSEQGHQLAPDIEELDRRNESRLTSIWRELRSLAEVAAARADKLERRLCQRLEVLERQRPVGGGRPERFTEEMAKEFESMKFRLSWIEWATSGEKRSFSRPLHPQAAGNQGSSVGTCSLPAVLAADSEVWAREPSGRVRPRRRLQVPNANVLVHSGLTSSESGGPGRQAVTASRSCAALLH